MSLRDQSYQSAIELGEADTEYISALKIEREALLTEVDHISDRLARIEELLRK